MAYDFKIRKYKSADHEAVCKIFYNGMVEHIPYGCKVLLSKPQVIFALASLLTVGAIVHSWICGLFLAGSGIMTCMASMFYCFYQYSK